MYETLAPDTEQVLVDWLRNSSSPTGIRYSTRIDYFTQAGIEDRRSYDQMLPYMPKFHCNYDKHGEKSGWKLKFNAVLVLNWMHPLERLFMHWYLFGTIFNEKKFALPKRVAANVYEF